MAKDQLILWANVLGLKGISYRSELERTANIGTMFHGVIEQYTTPGELAIIDYDEYKVYGYQSKKEAANALRSFFTWFDKVAHRYHIKFTEKVVVGKHYGGTIDCGIDGWEDPKKAIFVDYKSGSDFYLSQVLQLAGYVRLYEEVEGPDTVEGVMLVHADKKHGKKAEAIFIHRKKLDPFLVCFDCLYNTAVATKMLESTWRDLCEEVY
ncbi:MAG: PD-(D/E)XK nuclease family protein [Ruminococcus flavefaciens]|nr:PD-(D/E)XK nuclease family protein [Ruminococcus flavefaciens]